ncbi:MAG: cytochrome C class I protein [Ignavibacteria bacterium CG22_combo_CG10-13_8_21_14_all_37_15]|nr:cytochrome c [Ignavibacteria bacterium]PIP77269.1 MAG: cytochrome C class I protein [Ignavibacteria bacterium CG22_combo_CG10-13_8_21_14_all_37_15]
MKYFLRTAIIVAVLIAGYLVFIYSGIYNISAMVPHNNLTLWMMNTVRDNSVKHNADDKIKMPDLSDKSLLKMGFVHYREMCVSCHGAPGIKQSEFAEGLYPNPPMLSKVAKEWTPQQLFWITKNGLKMTGMPAFGPTHTDDMIWAIVAFTKTLPTMTKEQYQVLDNETKGESDEAD